MLSDDNSSSDDEEEVDAIINASITMAHEYIFSDSDSDTSDSTSKWGGSRRHHWLTKQIWILIWYYIVSR